MIRLHGCLCFSLRLSSFLAHKLTGRTERLDEAWALAVFSQNLQGYEDIWVCSSVLCMCYCSTNWFADRWKEVTFIRFTSAACLEFSPVQALLMRTYCFSHLLALLFGDWLRLLPSNAVIRVGWSIFWWCRNSDKSTCSIRGKKKVTLKVVNWKLKCDQCVTGKIFRRCCFGIV